MPNSSRATSVSWGRVDPELADVPLAPESGRFAPSSHWAPGSCSAIPRTGLRASSRGARGLKRHPPRPPRAWRGHEQWPAFLRESGVGRLTSLAHRFGGQAGVRSWGKPGPRRRCGGGVGPGAIRIGSEARSRQEGPVDTPFRSISQIRMGSQALEPPCSGDDPGVGGSRVDWRQWHGPHARTPRRQMNLHEGTIQRLWASSVSTGSAGTCGDWPVGGSKEFVLAQLSTAGWSRAGIGGRESREKLQRSLWCSRGGQPARAAPRPLCPLPTRSHESALG